MSSIWHCGVTTSPESRTTKRASPVPSGWMNILPVPAPTRPLKV
nr:MAG TPA: hypothetical protein [Caudoviricetes sp.]